MTRSHWHGSGGQGLRLPLAVPYSGPTGTQCNPRRAPPPGPFLLLRVGPGPRAGAGVGPAMLLRTRIHRNPQDLIPVQQAPPTGTRRDEDPPAELYGVHGIGPSGYDPRFSMNSAGAESGNPRFPIRPGTGNGAPAGPIGRKSGVGKWGNPPCEYSRHDPGLSGCCLSPGGPSESHADSGLPHLLNCQEPPADGG